jgi:hypothetical protein
MCTSFSLLIFSDFVKVEKDSRSQTEPRGWGDIERRDVKDMKRASKTQELTRHPRSKNHEHQRAISCVLI